MGREGKGFGFTQVNSGSLFFVKNNLKGKHMFFKKGELG